MEKLADLPTPALITLGFVLAVIMGVRFLGLWQGERSSPRDHPGAAQVAAVIVDPAALNRATEALARHTQALEKTIAVGTDLEKAISTMAIELDRIREELRIQREISRLS